MRAKDFMLRPQTLELRLKNKMAERDQLKALATTMTAGAGGERVKSSGDLRKMSTAMDRVVDMEREIDGLIDKIVDAKEAITRVIEQLSATEYDVLHKRYIQGAKYEQIAAKWGREYSWATTVHGRALKHVQEIIDTEGL